MIAFLQPTRRLAYLLAALFSFTCISAPAYSAIATTEMLAYGVGAESQRQALLMQLMRDDVQVGMEALGVDPADVQQRINSLTPAELGQLQARLDELPAGGNGLGTVAVVLLILILLEVAGVIDIFPKL